MANEKEKISALIGVVVILAVALIGGILTVFFGRNRLAEKSDVYQDLHETAVALQIENEEQQNDFVEICRTIDSVVAGIDNIKEGERSLILQGEVADVTAKEVATENLKLMAVSVERYKAEIKRLQRKLRNRPADLTMMVNSLKAQLEERGDEIERLMYEIGLKDDEIAALKREIGVLKVENEELQARLDSVNGKIEEQQVVIENQAEELNSAYYVVGTAAELKHGGVVVKKKVNPVIKAHKYTKVDVRECKTINLDTNRKVKVLSSHPANSYAIEEDAKTKNKTLRIKNNVEFWKQTKYLVIQIR